MRGVAAFLRGDVSEGHGRREGEDFLADLGGVVPRVGAGIFLGLFGMADGQQAGGDAAREGLFGDGRGTGEQQDLLGFVASVIDQGHAEAGEAQTGAAGDDDDGLHTIPGFVAAAGGADALVDAECHGGIVAGHGEGSGVDVGSELELVVDHGEVAAIGLEAEVGGVFGEGEGDTLFELGGVDGMAELEVGDEFLEVGIAGVLVELAFGDFGGEGLAAEIEAVVFEEDAGGEEGLAVEGDGEGLVDGPIVFGGERKDLVAEPVPGAGHFRGEVDAGGDGFFDELQWGGGFVEDDGQGLDGRDPFVVVLGKFGWDDGEGDIVRRGAGVIPVDGAGDAV